MNQAERKTNMRLLGVLGGVTAVALLAVGMLAGSIWTSPARAAGPPVPGTAAVDHAISVSGVGEIRQAPDMAYLNFQIHVSGASANEALAAYEKAATALTNALKAKGIAEADIVLDSPSTWPAPPDGKGPINADGSGSGYVADGHIGVTVRNLSILRDAAMEGLKAEAGIGLGGVQYALQNDQTARNAAMAKAIDSARAQADAVAAKLGLKVQSVVAVTVQPNFNGPGPYLAGGKGGSDMAAGAPGTANFAELGTRPEVVVNMTVQVSYSFE
ncbi:MAG TPA: SIMPL domain-containing protein [Chloroflexia bacterium]|nr:SIMPL domain-containing protein [Chloroflexia bacterium]